MDYKSTSRTTFLSQYEHNILLKLVFACGIGFVLLHLSKIIIFMWAQVPVVETAGYFQNRILPVFAIQPLDGMLKHPWTLLTYMFGGLGFFKMFTSMIWLYVFGSVIQNLIHKFEIIPLFLLSNIFGGIVFITIETIGYKTGQYPMYLGADAAILAFAAAAITLAPTYKFYLAERFAIPLWVLIVIYFILNVVVLAGSHNYGVIGLMIAGVVFGFVYIKLVQSGFRPGKWWARIFNKITNSITPEDDKIKTKSVSKRPFTDIDSILDKINEKGINSLTVAEKELLLQAGKDK